MIFQGLFIDGFAGGGGASTGIEQAIGRSVDIAINHSPTAIAIHRANHPATKHFCQDIKAVWPLAATRMQPVAGAWFSPDCKEFSKAKGGPVKDRSIRALCWEVIAWLKDTRPTVGYLENVEEFEYAAPLDDAGNPIKGAEGREFRRFVRAIRALGYRVQWRVLKACDYGAPTSRKRLYMVMRCDGLPIVWPKPTHGAPGSPGVRRGKLLPWRTAAECIDWEVSCPSIFERKRELADATKRRIAHGVMRYVVNAAEPFIVPVTHAQKSPRTHASSEPLRTITAANGGELAAVDVTVAPHITKFRSGSVGADMGTPMPTVTANGEPARPAGATPLGIIGATLVTMGYGERPGQQPRVPHVDTPLRTIVAGGGRGGGKAAAVTAFLSSFYGSDQRAAGGDVEQPLRTARAGGQHHAIVTAHIEQANGGPRNKRLAGRDARRPLSTATTTGAQQRIVQTTLIDADALPAGLAQRASIVAAFLIKYYGNESDGHGLSDPIHTVTTKDRFAVVTVTIDARTYVIVDIGLRMLKPRELARAQGFPESYVLDPLVTKMIRGKPVTRPLTISEQISAIGNSVCPPVARALVLANQPGCGEAQKAA